MYNRRIIIIHEVLPILLISFLGTLLYNLKIEFTYAFDWIIISKIILISISSILYYQVTIEIRNFEKEAEKEYYDALAKEEIKLAKNDKYEISEIQGIDDRFYDKINANRGELDIGLFISVILGLGFFFLEPIVKIL